ncbi:O-antigen ligase family protein [Pseudarthrobacter phenanthrenivorans]|uniref:O-antigen ligase family protein n=1 Tax=Pseudarthrobacter phenanthrenivorans TaxID=361575 RepID=UPI0015E866A8|nr:O-antigen ligase family protein [Pseudarthrobacter phenanthrenivorans]
METRAADSALIRALSWIGIFLIANDGITDRRRLLVLLRRVAVIGALMSTLGLVQFTTGQSIVSAIDIPGFTSGSEFANVQSRAGFLRAAGTASHPLEYGVVLCMSLPIAITLALNELRGRSVLRWLSVGAILMASALSVSRSALIGIAAGLVVLFPSWSKAVRIRAALAALAGVGAMYVLVPGMVGTVRGLFTGLSEDASTASRTNSYAAALEVASRNSVVGRGFGTFLPEYRILDNQYLLLLVEVGTVGLISFVLLIAAGIYCCERARRRFEDALMRQLSVAVMASLAAGALTFAFFDAFSFPMSAAYIFLLLGVAGAMWRIAEVEGSAARRSAGGRTGNQDDGDILQSSAACAPGKEGAAEVPKPRRFADEPPEDSPRIQ